MTRADYDPSCEICAHAIEHDWFGLTQGTTHCPRINQATAKHCHATWSGFAAIHCVKCHRTFSSNSGLERHQIPRFSGTCHDPATLFTKSEAPMFTSFVNQYGTEIWRMAGPAAPWQDKET